MEKAVQRLRAAATAPGAVVASDRVAGFDLLRGICALAVAIYHVLYWHNAAHLHTWGTYGVYIFFVLSGASMYVAYAERFERSYPVGRFLALRFIRLAPLYCLGLLLAASYAVYKGTWNLQHIGRAVLNMGLVFGLGNPGSTFEVPGGWSIGIEFAFYLLFPTMLALVTGRRWLWFVLGAFTMQHIFINVTLAGGGIEQRWGAYTQPMAFLFYFAAGCAIGRALRAGALPSGLSAVAALCGSIAAIGLANTAAWGWEYSITGLLGMALSLLAAVAVASSATLQFGPLGHRLSEILGRASYGVYILHPWAWAVVAFVGRRVGADPVTVAIVTAGVSVPLALAVERWLEKPAQRWMKARLAS